jgi:hypothetical protein
MTKDAGDPLVQELMSRLRDWAHQQRGRPAQLARDLGVKPSAVADWMAGRTCPSFPKGLRIQQLLANKRVGR